MGEGGKTIVVSNRTPVTFSLNESGERRHSRGTGGLVTALNAVVRRAESTVWIASAESEEYAEVSREPASYEVESNTLENWVVAQMRDIEAYREQHG